MPMEVTGYLGLLGIIAAMICIYVFVMPEKKYNTLTPFLKWLADLFNFKKLWLESILKFFYILCTTACVVYGVLMLISVEESFWGGTRSMAGPGLALLIVGPVCIRLIYESFMMIIILVKNVMEINNRQKGKDTDVEKCEPAAKPVMNFASPAAVNSPSQNDKKVCPNCGAPVDGDDIVFCPNCGIRVK